MGCLQSSAQPVVVTSAQHDDGTLRLPLSKHASPVGGEHGDFPLAYNATAASPVSSPARPRPNVSERPLALVARACVPVVFCDSCVCLGCAVCGRRAVFACRAHGCHSVFEMCWRPMCRCARRRKIVCRFWGVRSVALLHIARTPLRNARWRSGCRGSASVLGLPSGQVLFCFGIGVARTGAAGAGDTVLAPVRAHRGVVVSPAMCCCGCVLRP
jgi:hypothetical protein